MATDKVFTLGEFDDVVVRNSILYCMFLFNDVLDVSKLCTSLNSLLKQEGWHKIGARLRRNKQTGGLEHHIPVEFTESRPAFKLYQSQHAMGRAEHPIASQLPRMKTQPTVMMDPNKFRSLWDNPDIPTKMSHYLERDEPQLSLVIVSFDDSTVMTLVWSHTLFDFMGMGEMLRAWSLTLQDRSDNVDKPYPVQENPLTDLGRRPTELHKLHQLQLLGVALVLISIRTLVEIFLYRQQSRIICVPARHLQTVREEALDELSAASKGPEKPFVSEGDVLFAWWAQLNTAHLAADSNKPVNLTNALGWRPTLLPPNRPYLCNAVGFAHLLMPARDILSKPLGFVALQIRQCIVESRRREQIEAYASIWRKCFAKLPPLFGSANMHVVTCTNWTQARVFDLDFSAAIVPSRLDTTRPPTERGRPCYVQCCFHGAILSNVLIILGRDLAGNYWLSGSTTRRRWARIEAIVNTFKDDI
ncbi:hypothetical protein H634G_09739 [Metarhizium anisopliae BRIP 53293]|uniref:Uncharacterized protein n=1 Tax=Metarhizium anisopliae BRIP 53293 TaxID=1291518 RepID=A0A0D9NQK0_METAN|nr:hypothetical protein H634G_09739 [Metarhizium anisopliae BRIP 53293]KJK93620.1 hypothetical protein H633G_02498 [Metarhizium anisopliae BRIP 53284]